MNRRLFLKSTGVLTAGAALSPDVFGLADIPPDVGAFEWNCDGLFFSFDVHSGRLRQRRLIPPGAALDAARVSSGVEVAIQCSGENSPDQGMKSAIGQPGARLRFVE